MKEGKSPLHRLLQKRLPEPRLLLTNELPQWKRGPLQRQQWSPMLKPSQQPKRRRIKQPLKMIELLQKQEQLLKPKPVRMPRLQKHTHLPTLSKPDSKPRLAKPKRSLQRSKLIVSLWQRRRLPGRRQLWMRQGVLRRPSSGQKRKR